MEWSGHAVLEPGRLIYRGRLGAAHQHSHAAVQVVVAAEPAVDFSDVHGHRVRSQAAIIPAGTVHAVDAADTDVLMIYLEPTTAAGRRLASVLGESRCDCATTWAAAADGAQVSYVTDASVSNAADAALQRVTVAIRPRPSVVHPSVARAVTLIPRLLSEPIRLTDVAAAVHLSPDRLGRLFARDLGLSFSAYVRWSRLIRAMEVARTGGTLTDAAHAAGFADSSHANRAFHEMFGMAPMDARRGVIVQ